MNLICNSFVLCGLEFCSGVGMQAQAVARVASSRAVEV